MDAPAVLYALRWLILDTFRQTLTSRVFWILLAMSGLCIVFCLGVSVEGGAIRDGNEFYHPKTNKLLGAGESAGHVSLSFGAFSYPFGRTAEREVQFILDLFALIVGGTVGILVLLVFTAGFIPESLQPSAAAVLLAKPAPRWLFLLGKYVGVVSFVALHVTIFFVGTWLAIGLRTDIWPPQYLLGIPLMIFHFAVVFAFSVMLAVMFRSSMACVVGSVLFWFACYGINYGRHFALVSEQLGGPAMSGFAVFLSELGYWLLPKPIDLTLLFERALNFQNFTLMLDANPFKTMLEKNLFHPIASILSSCLFPVFALWAAASQLAKTDY